MDTAYILAITIDNMPITEQLLHIIDIFLGQWKLIQGKKQQIDDVLEWLLKGSPISSSPPIQTKGGLR